MPDATTTDETFDQMLENIMTGGAPALPDTPEPVEDTAHQAEPPAPEGAASPSGAETDAPASDAAPSPDSAPFPGAAPSTEAAPKWEGLSEVGKVPDRFYTKHLSPEVKETLRLAVTLPNLPAPELAALARKNLNLPPVETANPSPNGNHAPEPEAREEPAAELARIEALLAEKAEADGVGSVFDQEVKQALDRKMELLVEARLAAREQTTAEERRQDEFNAADDAARALAVKEFPSLADPTSDMSARVMQVWRETEALAAQAEANPSLRHDPDVALRLAQYNHPNFAHLIAQEVARDMGDKLATTAMPGASSQATSKQGGAPANGAHHPAMPGFVPTPGSVTPAQRVTVTTGSLDPIASLRAAAQKGEEEFGAALEQAISGSAATLRGHSANTGRMVIVG